MGDAHLAHAQEHFALEEARKKEALVKQTLRDKACVLIGRSTTLNYFGRYMDLAFFGTMKQIKEIKLYREYGDGTWEGFCQVCGVKTRTIDEHIQQIDTLGLEFLESAQKAGLSRTDLRRMEALPSDSRVEVVSKLGDAENISKEQVRELIDKIEDQAADNALLKDKWNKAEEKLAKKDAAIIKGREQFCELEDQMRGLKKSMEQTIVRNDEAQSVEILTEAKRVFITVLVKISRVDMDTASAGIKAAVVSLYEYMNRMMKQQFCEIVQKHPEIDAHDVLDIPGFQNPWDDKI